MASGHEDHGSTPAAWTAVVVILVGSVIGAVGVVLLNWLMFGVGVVVMFLGGIVGKVMQMMGMGKTVAYQQEAAEEAVGH